MWKRRSVHFRLLSSIFVFLFRTTFAAVSGLDRSHSFVAQVCAQIAGSLGDASQRMLLSSYRFCLLAGCATDRSSRHATHFPRATSCGPVGTLLNLAVCLERQGQVVAAFHRFERLSPQPSATVARIARSWHEAISKVCERSWLGSRSARLRGQSARSPDRSPSQRIGYERSQQAVAQASARNR